MSNYVLDDKYITWMIDRDTVLIISLTSGGGDGEIERETEKEGDCVCVCMLIVFLFSQLGLNDNQVENHRKSSWWCTAYIYIYILW